MKKLYKIFLIGTMSLMLAACGNDEANATKAVEENSVEENVEKPVAEESVAEEPVTESAAEEST